MPDDQPPDDPIIQLEQVRRQKAQQTTPAGAHEFSDDALALRFAEQHQDKLRYVALWGKWMLWDGSHWKSEDTLKAFDLARALCRGASAEVSAKQQAAAIASAKTVNAVASLSRSDRRVAQTIDIWDCDQGRLNTPDGTIDLNQGE
jgi:putative DNA primase/helicase